MTPPGSLHCSMMASIEPIRPLNELPMAQPRVVTAPRNLTLEVLRALAHPARMEVVALHRRPRPVVRLPSRGGPRLQPADDLQASRAAAEGRAWSSRAARVAGSTTRSTRTCSTPPAATSTTCVNRCTARTSPTTATSPTRASRRRRLPAAARRARSPSTGRPGGRGVAGPRPPRTRPPGGRPGWVRWS